jgi:hypothetical protein
MSSTRKTPGHLKPRCNKQFGFGGEAGGPVEPVEPVDAEAVEPAEAVAAAAEAAASPLRVS